MVRRLPVLIPVNRFVPSNTTVGQQVFVTGRRTLNSLPKLAFGLVCLYWGCREPKAHPLHIYIYIYMFFWGVYLFICMSTCTSQSMHCLRAKLTTPYGRPGAPGFALQETGKRFSLGRKAPPGPDAKPKQGSSQPRAPPPSSRPDATCHRGI